ncbi:MAG: efflux RND transporter periplasmic adaptor subunit [Chlamydiae bacterium]|nr:efflux RND transporter periplasmic adaptor subunit [Chlamydiota bacterium]
MLKSKKALLLFIGIIIPMVSGLVAILKGHSNNKQQSLVLYGNVDIREVDLGFRVAGRLQEIYFDEGDYIKKGDLLGKLDSTPYQDKVKKAKAEADSAKIASISADKKFQRRQIAITTSAISEEDFENSMLNLKQLQANFQAAEANLASAKTDLSDCLLYSPSDGFILTRIREPGTIMSAGEPVYSLSLETPVWIRSYVDEPDLGKIYPGMQAEIITDSSGDKVYKGHIGFISPIAEFTPKTVESPQLRTDLVYRLRVIVDDPDNGIRQGMPVTIKLLQKTTN